jgi:thymidine kinase
MGLTLIVGPMKSGKSLELIARVAPYEFANKRVLYVQSNKDVRDEGITSRAGINTKATRVRSLAEVKNNVDVIGIDEVHMFDESDAQYIARWLKKGKEVFASGLDLDYSASLTPMVKRLIELKPENIITKTAVCEACHEYRALFTQILHKGQPVLGGLPPIVPEDGTYVYQARCRDCYEHPAYSRKSKTRNVAPAKKSTSRQRKQLL